MKSFEINSLPRTISPTDLATVSSALVTVVDVRTPAEYESSHIPGSYNVPLDSLNEHASELRSSVGGPVVLVCRSGMRARQAEEALLAADLPRLHVLDGGLSAWEMAGLPVNRGQQRWAMERQVRAVAGGLTLTAVLAGFLIWQPLAVIAAGVGGGLLASALTDSCTMAKFLSKLPYNRAAGCDVRAVIRSIGTSSAPTTSSVGD